MNVRTVIPAACAAVGLGVLLFLAVHSQRVLSDNLPPRTVSASAYDALPRAIAYKMAHGGEVISILGTGSMAPYIPAAPAGADPMKTVVAYVVTRPGATYADIKQGDLCIYKPEWSPGTVMHVAAQHDGLGWIMSGLHNAHSEPFWRVTATNFVGIVAATFTSQ